MGKIHVNNYQIGHEFGWLVGQEGEKLMRSPSSPIDELRYGKGCAFSPNSNKAYSNFVCFFVLKRSSSSGSLSLLI